MGINKMMPFFLINQIKKIDLSVTNIIEKKTN